LKDEVNLKRDDRLDTAQTKNMNCAVPGIKPCVLCTALMSGRKENRRNFYASQKWNQQDDHMDSIR
jgi:hypothetical protein